MKGNKLQELWLENQHLQAENVRLKAERDKYKAVLDGAGYRPGIAELSMEECVFLGQEAARITKSIIAERDLLRKETT